MGSANEKSSFDKLVAGLSADERTTMLRNINKNASPSVLLDESGNKVQEKNISLHLKFKGESVFYRFILWLRGIIEKKDPEKIYNDDVLIALARRVNRDHPGILDYRNQNLDSVFYERLKMLKESADFFKPYFAFIEDNPGDFYVFLSSFVAPELADKINSEADPFTLGFDANDDPATKNDLLKKLDNILKNIDGGEKSSLYSSVSALNWLKLFTRLPYLHFISQFTNIVGAAFTCPYRNACTDFDAFAAVFTNVQSVQNEVLEAMFLFSQKKDLSKTAQQKDIEKGINEFLSASKRHFLDIQAFITGVPILKLGKIINDDYDWTSGNIEGVEAWFPSFRSHWRKIFDVRWTQWLRERKKNMLSNNLMLDFGLSEFPSMKFKPWQDLWLRVPFACELTGGFLSWFEEEVYDDVITPLNEVMMEGIFIRSENREEYSEGLNLFVQANSSIGELLNRLSPAGEYGQLFDDFATNKIRSFQVQNQIDSMMATTESAIREAGKKFEKGCKMMEYVLRGIFDEEKDALHDGLSNLTMIKGHQNRMWRDKISRVREKIQKASFYIKELTPIDSAAVE
ncbi:MAG: DUF5312 domain-containing protein [Treponema sp.]|nr:DUF5312 domain-containing protein [Treponema sp.]